ncbi:hypothetical protein BC628DRAFT_1422474 [Trametes gibbosa]|nr:hypothetical protein BC628DRAFT_1422474 [Trametes gibbosa]
MSESQSSDSLGPSPPQLSTDELERMIYGSPFPRALEAFWNGCRPWLAKHGVLLYELCLRDGDQDYASKWWRSPTNTSDIRDLPYSICTGKHDSVSPVLNTLGHRRIACAQDTLHRDIIMKTMITGSTEHQIYQRIQDSLPAKLFADGSTFPCILPPISILDSQYGYTFAVTPMWGSPLYIEDMRTVGEAMRFMQCYLQGMLSLHQLRIAYRDVWDYNTVINRHSPFMRYSETHRESLRAHRAGSDVYYALIDFDQSVIFPLDAALEDCLLPLSEASAGANTYKPLDIHLAPPYYNPFAFDVGAAGFLFRRYFPVCIFVLSGSPHADPKERHQTVVPFIPELAALFDRMTDRCTARRFSAADAFSFVRGLAGHVSPDVLEAEVVLQSDVDTMDDANVYWSKVPAETLRVWAMYRTPPQSSWARFLDWLADIPQARNTLRFVRRLLQL